MGCSVLLVYGICSYVYRAWRLRNILAMVRELTGWSRPKGALSARQESLYLH